MDTWFTHSKRPRRLQGLSTRSVAFAFAPPTPHARAPARDNAQTETSHTACLSLATRFR